MALRILAKKCVVLRSYRDLRIQCGKIFRWSYSAYFRLRLPLAFVTVFPVAPQLYSPFHVSRRRLCFAPNCRCVTLRLVLISSFKSDASVNLTEFVCTL